LSCQAFVDGTICFSLVITVEKTRLSVYICTDMDAQLVLLQFVIHLPPGFTDKA